MIAKRTIDILLAAVLITLTVPVMIVVAAVIRLTIGRPVLFRQVRPGLGGQPFTIYKFRTMRSDGALERDSANDAARMTRLGAVLRRLSIDELPELWNVIKGDMSLVGPRPLLMEYLSLYTDDQARRHEMKPGLTGLVQVSGRNELSWDERLALDVWYVDHHSLWLDLKILARTVKAVLERRGITAPGHATMPKFRGGA